MKPLIFTMKGAITMYRSMMKKAAGLTIALFMVTTALNAQSRSGMVYTMTNAPGGNEVVAYERAMDGMLTPAGMFMTGGTGTGSGLGNQGALAMSGDGRFLFVVNAGSNNISSFRITDNGLFLVDIEPSGGMRPISLTAHRDRLFVLNAGGDGNISGFWIGRYGHLMPIANSTLPLSSNNSDPAQISFGPNGLDLYVTEKATNKILVYNTHVPFVPARGPMVFNSAGMTPFGFGFDNLGHLIVSEAFGGNTDASAVSSYHMMNGNLMTVSASVPTTETAACWIAISKNGRFAYTTNTGSSSVTGYRINHNGQLMSLNGDGKTGMTGDGTRPIDAAFSNNGRFLYVLNGGNPSITIFEWNSNGSLTHRGSVNAPAGASGLVVK